MTKTALQKIALYAEEGTQLRASFFEQEANNLINIALNIACSVASGNKVLLCGNGGSAADCQHIAAEFVNRFIMERPPLPAIALTTDSSILTSIGNDYDFNSIFSKQVSALGSDGDILIAISTSGNSQNVIAALNVARDKNLKTIGFTGKSGGEMLGLCDFMVRVDSTQTPLIQEIHIAAAHIICDLTDHFLFENVAALSPYLKQ